MFKDNNYELGNCLRGYVSGRFHSDDEAWEVLSHQFDILFSSPGGRKVQLMKILCIRDEFTPGNVNRSAMSAAL